MLFYLYSLVLDYATYCCALHFSFFFFSFLFFLCNVYVQPVEFWQTWSVFTIHNLPDFMPLIFSNFARSCRNKCATFGLPSPEFIQGGFHLLGRFPFPFRLRLPRPFYFSYSYSLLSIIQTDCGKDYECTISALEARFGLEKVVVCICSEPFTRTAHFPDELSSKRERGRFMGRPSYSTTHRANGTGPLRSWQ